MSRDAGQRRPTVCWLWPGDFQEGPGPAWVVERERNQDVVSCWQVVLYEHAKSTCGYLMVHAVRGNGNDGGQITLAISATPRYDLYARETFATMSPRRHVDVDHWREDGA